jgi:hypothetical protein
MSPATWRSVTNLPVMTGASEDTRLVEVVDPDVVGIHQRYYRLLTPALSDP